MPDYLFRGSLEKLDKDVYELTQLEQERQARKLILIASESTAPMAVREALSSAFQNIYAEGYPDEETRWMDDDEILDYPMRLANYRRNSDPRYYKGVEYADVVEALARRRAAQTFAANGYSADQIYVNVQALSGGPANNAVYHALIELGSTVMGLNLLHGGHLSHGSSVNRSGKWFKAVHYTIDENEKLDYDAIRALANEHKPKLMIAGYSSYSWMPDWKKFREIADEVGAYLLADISHIGGLVAAGVVPSPIGYAHVVMSTTHKSIDGPRGAVLMTTDASIAKKLDKAVFPGEQGGPHVNVFAALALTFKLTQTRQFKQLQAQTLKNAKAMADQFTKRGLRVPFGGTDTHLVNVDCTSIVGADGTKLSGDQASRILDLAGVVVNRNTIPGDKNALDPSGIRLGTPWITQRGFNEKQTRQLADIMADVLLACAPHSVDTARKGKQRRAKVDFNVLNVARLKVRKLTEKAGIDFKFKKSGYPHYYFIDDVGQFGKLSNWVFELKGQRVRQMLDYAVSSDLSALKKGETQATEIATPKGKVKATLKNVDGAAYQLSVPANKASVVATWLRDLSDGYVSLNLDGEKDFSARRIPGPTVVSEVKKPSPQPSPKGRGGSAGGEKPWFVGVGSTSAKGALSPFVWNAVGASHDSPLQKTALNQVHRDLGGRMVPFAGWEMPVQYTGIYEEHLATRQAAGLFDVSHMGVYDVRGADAASFLDAVCGNDCGGLTPGESLYTHFLTPDADVIDDTLVYRRGWDDYLVVVNASNDDKDRTWLEAVRDGKALIDHARPWARTFGYNAEIRNLRDPKAGDAMRVDIALQGPKSREILFAMGVDTETRTQVNKLKRTELCNAVIGNFDLIVSRTGYTGEKMAFELFVHPDRSVDFWNAILKAGEPFGVKPVGLGARDSLRTEAGLPLYGHEMGLGSKGSGERDLGVAEGGFGSYVKTYKPWFIGRDAFVAREKERKGVVVRFTFDEQRVRMAHNGDPVVNANGERIGFVTSCAIDSARFITGQAFVDLKYAKEGTPILIHQGGVMDRPASTAKVVSRFAKL
ncbi:MAG: glycine cleavage system aminomethyltransferase GcvT [Anaerolineae bacterium]|nr:MAG: glycine cleavage system aminomethyltransferase GcvT [Anaerolineae bacterium]WKZ44201.1 MAG: glycine cleavage system aminomethyltransferase GcvT [Anaerolineales bacterium]